MLTRGFFVDKVHLWCKIFLKRAGIAQLVEPHVANVIVAGSSPVSRSKQYARTQMRYCLNEIFEKRSILLKVKEGEDFNRRNTR